MAGLRDAMYTETRGRFMTDGDIADALLALIDGSSFSRVETVMRRLTLKGTRSNAYGGFEFELDRPTREWFISQATI